MSAQLKEVRNRITSIGSMQQITKAMKMVSAAKLRRAQESIIQMRPYAQKLQEMLGNIVGNIAEGSAVMKLAKQREIKKVLFIVITSDKGLCGAFNANVVKLAESRAREKYPEALAAGNITVWPLGKKGAEILHKSSLHRDEKFINVFSSLSFSNAQRVAQAAVAAFEQESFDVVEIFYNQFKNAAVQQLIVEPFLPIVSTSVSGKKAETKMKVDFIFEPEEEVLLSEMMPKILNTQLYKALLDSNASEHGARMTSMDQATKNANELLKSLKISYNRARQAAITTELTEIVSGAEALAN